MTLLADVLIQDVAASLPAAGAEGRVFLASDTEALYYDNGTTWDGPYVLGGSPSGAWSSAPSNSILFQDNLGGTAIGSTDGTFVGDNGAKAQIIKVDSDVTIDGFVMECVTTGNDLLVCLYEFLGNGLPGDSVTPVGTIDCGTTGNKQAAISSTLVPAGYYFALFTEESGSNSGNVVRVSSSDAMTTHELFLSNTFLDIRSTTEVASYNFDISTLNTLATGTFSNNGDDLTGAVFNRSNADATSTNHMVLGLRVA